MKQETPFQKFCAVAGLMMIFGVAVFMTHVDQEAHEEAQRHAMAQMNKRILALNPDPAIVAYSKEFEE